MASTASVRSTDIIAATRSSASPPRRVSRHHHRLPHLLTSKERGTCGHVKGDPQIGAGVPGMDKNDQTSFTKRLAAHAAVTFAGSIFTGSARSSCTASSDELDAVVIFFIAILERLMAKRRGFAFSDNVSDCALRASRTGTNRAAANQRLPHFLDAVENPPARADIRHDALGAEVTQPTLARAAGRREKGTQQTISIDQLACCLRVAVKVDDVRCGRGFFRIRVFSHK